MGEAPRKRWCDQFDKLHNGVIQLFRDRAIWRTILAMLDANPVSPAVDSVSTGSNRVTPTACFSASAGRPGPTMEASASGAVSRAWPLLL